MAAAAALDRRVVAGVLTATLLAGVGIGAVLPVLPRYVAGPLDGGELTVGVVVGCYTLSALLCRPFAGRLSDRRGRRPVALGGLGTLAVGGALLFLPAGVAGLIVARLILGLGLGSANTASNLWLIDAAPAGRRGQVIGLLGLAIWGGLAFGSLVGEALLAVASYPAVWWLAALAPVTAALVLRRTPEARAPAPPAVAGPILPRAAIAPGVALLLTTVGWGTASGFVVLHLSARGIGAAATVLTAFAIALILTRLAAGRLPDRAGPRPTAAAGGAAQTVGLALLAVAPSEAVALTGGLVLGAGTSLVFPALGLIVMQRSRRAERGAALGGFTSFFDAGVGLGAPLAGAVAALAGYEAAFWAAAGCVALGTLVAVRCDAGGPHL